MSPWIRLLEKLGRIPHKQEDSDRVHEAATALEHSKDRLRIYLELGDPIAATAVFFLTEK
jgi:hypothetical protein